MQDDMQNSILDGVQESMQNSIQDDGMQNSMHDIASLSSVEINIKEHTDVLDTKSSDLDSSSSSSDWSSSSESTMVNTHCIMATLL